MLVAVFGDPAVIMGSHTRKSYNVEAVPNNKETRKKEEEMGGEEDI